MRTEALLLAYLKRLVQAASGRLTHNQLLIITAGFIGVWAGLSAVALKQAVHYSRAGIMNLAAQSEWVRWATPAAGIFITVLVIRFFFKGNLRRGTSHVLEAISRNSSRLPFHETYAHLITSAATVGLGGSAGLESPIIQTGASIGANSSSLFPFSYRDRTLLLACGAAAGIAAAFNAPIAGVLFALEVLLVDVTLSAFIPLLIAGAIGSLCSTIVLHDEILLSFQFRRHYALSNLPYYALLGLLCGVFSVVHIKISVGMERLLSRSIQSALLRVAMGGVLLAFLVFLFPPLFGEGYELVRLIASQEPSTITEGSPLHPWLLNGITVSAAFLLIGMLKSAAVGITLGSGGNGGNFAPSLVVGACYGFSFAILVNQAGPNLPVSNFALAGMAGLLSGVFHSPLTGLFLIVEVTGGYDLMVPLMMVVALSAGISRYLHRLSLDETKMKSLPASGAFDKDTSLLAGISVRSLIEKDFEKLSPYDTLGKITEAVAKSKRNFFPVIDGEGVLVGIVILDDIREIMFDHSRHSTTLVNQLMSKPDTVVDLNEPMSSVMLKFDKSGKWNLPVVDKHNKYIGFVSKASIFTQYRSVLRHSD